MYWTISMRAMVAVLVLALVLAPVTAVEAGSLRFRTPSSSGDMSSDGAVITIGLLATVCVVMLLLGVKADFENVFTKKSERESDHMRDLASDKLQEITEGFDARGRGSVGQSDAVVGLAWNVRF